MDEKKEKIVEISNIKAKLEEKNIVNDKLNNKLKRVEEENKKGISLYNKILANANNLNLNADEDKNSNGMKDNDNNINDDNININNETQNVNNIIIETLKNKNEELTKEELFNFMRKLGYRPSDLELREMMEEVAKEHPGQITYEEFKYILSKPIKDELTVNSTIEAFSVFDKMMKGKIKKDDLKNILLSRGEQNMIEEEIQDLLDHYVDFDENGEIDYKNFVKKTFDLFK